METQTKVLIGVAVVAAVGLYWWHTTKAAAALGTVPANKPLGTGAGSGASGGGAPGGGGPGGNGTGPGGSPGGTFVPGTSTVSMLSPTTFSPGAVMTAPSLAFSPPPSSTSTANSVQGPYGVISWGDGATYDASTGIVTNNTQGPVTITVPTFDNSGKPDGGSTSFSLTPGQPRYDTGTVNIGNYGSIT
jgi:hypothetical protein